MQVQRLPEPFVRDHWSRIQAVLQPAFDRAEGIDPKEVRKQCVAGFKQVWEVSDGPKGLIVTSCGDATFWVEYVAGTWGAKGNVQTLIAYFEALAKRHGYRQLKIYGRKGWQRLLPEYEASQKRGHIELEKVL